MIKNIITPDPRKEVVVKNHVYGEYTRAPRGSKTPAPVNDVFAEQAEKTDALNAAAKAVYDVLKLYTGYFREGQLWQCILSRMRKANSMHTQDLLSYLEKLEINRRYPLGKFGYVPEFYVEKSKTLLHITMQPRMQQLLYKNDDCYQYDLVTLLFNSEGICVQHSKQQTAWLYEKDAPDKHEFEIKKPKNARYCLLCLHLQGGVGGIASDVYPSRGMMIVECWVV